MLRIAAIVLVIGASACRRAGRGAVRQHLWQIRRRLGRPGTFPMVGSRRSRRPDQYPGQQQYSAAAFRRTAAIGRAAAVQYPGAAATASPQAPRPHHLPGRPGSRARREPASRPIRSSRPIRRPRNPPIPRRSRTTRSITETPTQKIPNAPSGVFRPRQDHRPHHFVRRGDRRNGAIRRAAGHRAGVLHAAADRGDEHRCLRRRRRGDAQGRDQAHLHRLDVRFEPGPACRRASDLRRLADRLLPTRPGRRRRWRNRPTPAPAPAAPRAATPASAASRRVQSLLAPSAARADARHPVTRSAPARSPPGTGRSSASAPKSPSPTSAASSSLW